MGFLCILEQPLLSANTFPSGHSSHSWAMKEATEGGFGYCSTSTLNFLLDNVWDTEKYFLILYLLLSTGQWHTHTKTVLLHVLCSEKKCWVKTGWGFLVNCFPELDLDWREPRFHCQGGFGRLPCCGCSGTRSPPCLDQGLLGKDAWEQP